MKAPTPLFHAFALLLALSAALTLHAEGEATPLFDGKTLEGWKAAKPRNAHFWKVVDGVITGDHDGKRVPTNTYLVTEREFSDFELRCQFRISGDHQTGLINSGIQYRSQLNAKGQMVGYQADIGRGYWGDIYDEHRRGKLVKGDTAELMKTLVEDGWNEYRIRVQGKRHELFINGHRTVVYIEDKEDIPTKGIIGLQLHSGGAAKVEFKDITIKPL